MTRAALYMRISYDRTGQHLGVERQEDDCRELAAQLGWEVAEAYVDNDKSAYKRRPEYERMLVDIDAGKLDAIVAWHPDRLYRVVKDLGILVDVCKSNNTQIATVRAGTIDLTTPTGRLVAGLMAQVATYEGEAKADRWARSWRQGREAGRIARTGTRLFGYDQDMNVIDDEAKVASEMARHISEGQPILTVCRWLDDQGVTGTRGQAWTPAAVKYYLTNPRVAGWSTISHLEPTSKRNEKTGRPEMKRVSKIVARGEWDPVVDPEEWETVRALLTARTRPYVPRKALLGGLLFCGKCDFRMITSGQKRVRTYRCPNRPSLRGCGRCSGNAEPIEEVVEAFARERLSDPRIRKRIGELRAEPSGAQSEVAALELRITELERSLDDPGVPVAAILAALERAKDKQAALLDELASRNLAPLPAGDDEWPEDLHARRALVDLVVARVVLNPATRPSRYGFDETRVVIEPR